MKKTIFTRLAMAAITVAAIGCQREDALVDGGQNGSSANLVPFTINATLEGGETKTTLDAGGKVYWESGDAITVLGVGEDGTVGSYKFTTDEGGSSTLFKGDVKLAKDYYVIYPHNDVERFPDLVDDPTKNYKYYWKHTVSEGILNTYIPSTQKVSETAAGLGALSAGVVAADGSVQLKNIGGLIAINIPVDDIKHVILYGNAGESIVGNLYSAFGEDGLPVVSSVVGSNMVRMVPASGSTFNVGTYYINVSPITFTNGLTVLFTKSDGTWAQVRGTGQFVVERSKISQLPTKSSLNFGGKVVDVIFCTDSGSNTIPFEGDFPGTSDKNPKEIIEYTLDKSELKFIIMGTNQHYRNTGAKAGLNFGKAENDYIQFPAIDGYSLSKVVIKNGDMYGKNSGNPVIKDVNSASVPGCTPWTGIKAQGLEHIWSFAGTENTAYRLAISATDKNSYCIIKQIRLYYADAPDGVSSINPMITSVTTKEVETEHKGKVTFKGVFSAVDYQTSLLSCGFDYRPVGTETWKTVSLDPTANDFSYEVEIDSDEDYVYRAWTKVNATGKTVYGNEVQFNAHKLILHLVFDENRYETGYNYAWDTWEIGTNTNSAAENPNGATYNYTLDGVDYPFTFWSYRPEATKGGYALWVASTSKKVYGLSLSYTTGLADSQPAWMLMPGPKGVKLVEVDATLSNAEFKGFGGTISVSVNEDGTASGDPVATYTGKSSFPLSLEGTEAGKPYYFCTTHNNRPTLKDLTLTYLYVPAE